MTPIEILAAWKSGKRLQYNNWVVTDIIIKIFVGPNYYVHSPSETTIPSVTISRETFGFFKAINLMREGKHIKKESTANRRYRIYNGILQYLLCDLPVDNDNLWAILYGYPLDWPDAQDFYEVE